MEEELKAKGGNLANRVLVGGAAALGAVLVWAAVFALLERLGVSMIDVKLFISLVVISVFAVDWLVFRRGNRNGDENI